MAQPDPFPGAPRQRRIESMEWFTEFLPYMKREWEPGQHMALIGPTGQGKTTFAARLLAERKWVLALDPKGEDETLTKSGFERITWWPLEAKPRGKKIRDEIAEGKPARLIVGGPLRSNEEMERLIALLRDAVQGAWGEGGWTLYADEFQLLGDIRMFGLGQEVERLLIAARSRGTSVVTSFQAPSWVPKAGTRQATFVVMLKTKSRDMIKVVAESVGREWHELAEAMDALPKYYVLVIPEDVDAPMILTHAPKLS